MFDDMLYRTEIIGYNANGILVYRFIYACGDTEESRKMLREAKELASSGKDAIKAIGCTDIPYDVTTVELCLNEYDAELEDYTESQEDIEEEMESLYVDTIYSKIIWEK